MKTRLQLLFKPLGLLLFKPLGLLKPSFYGIGDVGNIKDFFRVLFAIVLVFALIGAGTWFFHIKLKSLGTEVAEWETVITFILSTILSLFALFMSGAIAISQREQSNLARGTIAARQHLSVELGDQMRRIHDVIQPLEAVSDQRFVFEVYISTLAFGFLDRKSKNGSGAPYDYPSLDHFHNMLSEFCLAAAERCEMKKHSELMIYLWKPEIQDKEGLTKALTDSISEDGGLFKKFQDLVPKLKQLNDANEAADSSDRVNYVHVRIYFTERDDLRFFMLGDGGLVPPRIQLLLMTPVKPTKGGDNPTLDSILLSDQTPGGAKRLKEYAERFIIKHCPNKDSHAAETLGKDLLKSPETKIWELLGVSPPSSK